MADLVVNTVIFCDDVRKEINNKDMILGVFTGDILIQFLPASISLAFWIEMNSKSEGEQVFDVRIKLPGQNDSAIEGYDIRVSFSGTGPTSFAISRLSFQIEQEGEIEFYIRQNKGRWRLVRKKRVKVGSIPFTAASSAPPPPSEQSRPASPAS